MATSRYENPALRSWWTRHAEAWRSSGVSLGRYCAHHRLNRHTFRRWLEALGLSQAVALGEESRRELAAKRRRPKLSRDGRSRAVAAFWAMHVEALAWSGLTLSGYAQALRLPAKSLRTWRDRIEAEEVTGDWRSVLHPAARAQLSTGAKRGAKHEDGLTGATDGRRRRFPETEKLAIVEEAERSKLGVSGVARRHGIARSMLVRWRKQLGRTPEARLVSISLTDGELAHLLPNLGERTAR